MSKIFRGQELLSSVLLHWDGNLHDTSLAATLRAVFAVKAVPDPLLATADTGLPLLLML